MNCATAPTKARRSLAVASILLTLSAFAHSEGAAPVTLESLQDPARVTGELKVSVFRQGALREAALSLGSRGGLASQSTSIREDLEVRARRLDALYQFSPLMTHSGVMPPVIVEAQNAMTVQPDVMRIADRIYRIVAKARFVSSAPTWRDYLFLGLSIDAKPPLLPHSSLLPKTPEEQGLWRQWVAEGWNDGVKQANAIHELNMSRLDRDYQGMLRYSVLLSRGLVAEPVVGSDVAVVTGNANEMTLGDVVHRVTTPAKLVTDSTKWRPIITPAAPKDRQP